MREGNITRLRSYFNKQKIVEKEWMDSNKRGMAYKLRISLTEAKIIVKNAFANRTRNPKGTPREELKCHYHHPEFCNILDHVDARSKDCFAHGLSAQERDTILSQIFDEAVQKQLSSQENQGEYW